MCDTNCCSIKKAENKKYISVSKYKKHFGVPILILSMILAITAIFNLGNAAAVSAANETKGQGDSSFISTDKKVTYVLLSGQSEAKNSAVRTKVETVVSEIQQTGGSVGLIELVKGDTNYTKLVDYLKVKEFPSVLIVGKSSPIVVYNQHVKSITLVRAYDSAAALPSCTPGKSKTSCCVKK